MKDSCVNVQIGKNGLNDSQISEILKNLRARRPVRVKLLKSLLGSTNRKQVYSELVSSVFSKVSCEHKLVGNVIKFTPKEKNL
ncbi:YhbY family RNA-binding protein [Candidatus Woesearchaeota archaeon]|nr:YhbY family RNA-binding protein [Candidatus Woesearchaeota archaeon]